jgi:hypothetical protein
MKRAFAGVCLINSIYDIVLGLVFLVVPAFLLSFLGGPVNVYTISSFQVIGALLFSLGIGLFAAFRNLDQLLIIPLIKIVAHFLAGGLLIYHAITAYLSILLIALAVIDIIFGILYIVFFLFIKEYSFSAAFRTSGPS